ncbi:MAG: VanZ family protein, partial [Candidatus Omnitrophota bacterium]
MLITGYVLPDYTVNSNVVRLGDFVLHFGPFTVMFLAAAWAFHGPAVRTWRLREHHAALVYGLFLATLTENLQWIVPGRACAFDDWTADLAGTALG